MITDDESGYLLYQAYAFRATPPADAQPDAQSEPPSEPH